MLSAEGFEVQQEGPGYEGDKGLIIMQQRKGWREGLVRTQKKWWSWGTHPQEAILEGTCHNMERK